MENEGVERTFTAHTAHSRLLWLLAHDKFVFPKVEWPHEYGRACAGSVNKERTRTAG